MTGKQLLEFLVSCDDFATMKIRGNLLLKEIREKKEAKKISKEVGK